MPFRNARDAADSRRRRPRPRLLVGGYVDRGAAARRPSAPTAGSRTSTRPEAFSAVLGEGARVRRGGGARPRRARQRGAARRSASTTRSRPADRRVRELHRRLLRPAAVERVDGRERDPRHAGAVRRAARRAGRGGRPARLPGAACDYEVEQVERFAAEVLPLLAGPASGRRDEGQRRQAGRRSAERRARWCATATSSWRGGCCYSRTPWAMLLELLRAGRRDLTLARNLMCYESELFLATGAATKLVSSWVGIGLRWGIPKVFRQYVERDPAIYEEWSHLVVRAAAAGRLDGHAVPADRVAAGLGPARAHAGAGDAAARSPASCSSPCRRSCPTWR